MFRRILWVWFVLSISLAPAAQAQTDHTVYVPMAALTRQALGAGPDEVSLDEDVNFVPLAQIEPANNGSFTFNCNYGQRVTVWWAVYDAGVMKARYYFVRSDGFVSVVDRYYYAYTQGQIIAQLTPASNAKITRVNWVYSGHAQGVAWQCG